MRVPTSSLAIASVFSLCTTVFGQAEHQIYFCKDIDGKVAASDNFCASLGNKGVALQSPGMKVLQQV
ncbi:hypothetical protein DHEL01_v212536 [Diaporthe helianthi]|uniref:Uncharacterized protein n=1 Tax=Diaporthe helianthi TaxID=158607 RepID=A0A2P5HFN6_DIAHE|nr:hypothetical protein DHEL01_v212536 [Diaporthe helianthi]